jgi:hypothetical protein
LVFSDAKHASRAPRAQEKEAQLLRQTQALAASEAQALLQLATAEALQQCLAEQAEELEGQRARADSLAAALELAQARLFPSICPSVCLAVHPSISPSIHTSSSPPIHPAPSQGGGPLDFGGSWVF